MHKHKHTTNDGCVMVAIYRCMLIYLMYTYKRAQYAAILIERCVYVLAGHSREKILTTARHINGEKSFRHENTGTHTHNENVPVSVEYVYRLMYSFLYYVCTRYL